MAALGVGALILAGCGDGDESDGDTGRASPLAEFLGIDEGRATGVGGMEFTEEDRQRHHEVQELIVECMSEAGFEYYPEPFWGDREDLPGVDEEQQAAWQLREDDPEAFAQEWGYGITTMQDLNQVVTDPAEPAGPADDPNHEYRESLSPAAQEEYQKALWGDWEAVEPAEENGELEMADPIDVGGCHTEAQQAVHGMGELEQEFSELWDAIAALEERVSEDPEVAEAEQAWSSCMAEAGYSGLSAVDDAREQVYERQSELFHIRADPADQGDAAAQAEDGVEPEVLPSPDFAPPEIDPDELARVQDFEREIAVADFECQQDSELDRIQQEVRFTLEEEFIETHRDQLEAYRDWLDEQGMRG